MVLKTIAVAILVLGVGGLAFGALLMRRRRPYSAKLAQMGSIFDFGPKVRGIFPPYVEGMAGPYCARYLLLPDKMMNGISGARVDIPVDAMVSWSFDRQEIQQVDPVVFGASTDAFETLGRMPDCVGVGLVKGMISARFSAEKAGGEVALMDVKKARERIRTHYSLDKIVNYYESLYQDIAYV